MLPNLLTNQGFQAENLTVTVGIQWISHQVAKGEEELSNHACKWDVFWNYSCPVPLLWAPHSSVGLSFPLHGRDQSTGCGKVNFWPVRMATTGICLPKKVFLSSGLQLRSLFLSCLLFQTQCFSKLSTAVPKIPGRLVRRAQSQCCDSTTMAVSQGQGSMVKHDWNSWIVLAEKKNLQLFPNEDAGVLRTRRYKTGVSVHWQWSWKRCCLCLVVQHPRTRVGELYPSPLNPGIGHSPALFQSCTQCSRAKAGN